MRLLKLLFLLLLAVPTFAQDLRPSAYIGRPGVVTVRGGKILGASGGITTIAGVDITPSFRTFVSGHCARTVMETILPHMGQRRSAKIKESIKLWLEHIAASKLNQHKSGTANLRAFWLSATPERRSAITKLAWETRRHGVR